MFSHRRGLCLTAQAGTISDMKFQKFSLGAVACAAWLFLAGCNPPAPSARYIGTTKDADWPYRYRLAQTRGEWSGTIEHLNTNGWVFWDAMDITEQNKSTIKFKARIGDSASFRLGWYLTLGNISPQGFSGMLTGDIFDSRAIELFFTPAR
ncbi:MAG: hypothetical protein QOF48_3103 [Verrucomicrobiota bacterium]|jgi:hypothetical protein